MRASRVGCSSSADLLDVDTAPLPDPCPVSLAPLTGLPVELLGSTPVACTRHCNHARGFHGAGLLEHHRPVGLALLTGRPPQ